MPRVEAPTQKIAAKTACRKIVTAATTNRTTTARVRNTRMRRGSHVNRVSIVSFDQSAPPSEAPSSAPNRMTKVAEPCTISPRSRSCIPALSTYGPELARQNASRLSKPDGTCPPGPRYLPAMHLWNC